VVDRIDQRIVYYTECTLSKCRVCRIVGDRHHNIIEDKVVVLIFGFRGWRKLVRKEACLVVQKIPKVDVPIPALFLGAI
jgi:hypothetical protein